MVLPVASAFEREGLKIGFEISPEAQSLVQLRPAVVEPVAPFTTRAMADGISHAMIATMTGLVVSVIGLFFSNLFASRVRVETERLNDLIAPG